MKIIGFSGLSESGKSYAGKYLEKKGIPRVKLVKIIDEVREEYFSDEININDFHKYLYKPYNEFGDFFVNKVCEKLESKYSKNKIIVVESLRNPELGDKFTKYFGNLFFSVYFEAEFSIRSNREWVKIGGNLADVIDLTAIKDQEKVIAGVLDYKNSADLIFDNNGDILELNRFLDNLLNDFDSK